MEINDCMMRSGVSMGDIFCAKFDFLAMALRKEFVGNFDDPPPN